MVNPEIAKNYKISCNLKLIITYEIFQQGFVIALIY